MEQNFKKRRKIAAFTCVITLIVLIFNTRCSSTKPEPVVSSVTQKSSETIQCAEKNTPAFHQVDPFCAVSHAHL